MASRSFERWRSIELPELDQFEAARVTVGGRPTLIRSMNDAYLILLASRFQRFCRDLHSEAVEALAASIGPPLEPILQTSLILNRRLDTGNAQPATLADDFGRLGLDIWVALERQDKRNIQRKVRLQQINAWRNAVVHRDFRRVSGGTGVAFGTRLDTRWTRTWRSVCETLALHIDRAVEAHLTRLLQRPPW